MLADFAALACLRFLMFYAQSRAQLVMCRAELDASKILRPNALANDLFPMEATVRPQPGRPCWPSPSSILSGDPTFLAIRVGVREFPPLVLRQHCASSLPESCSTAGCASKYPVSVAAPLACRVASRSLHLVVDYVYCSGRTTLCLSGVAAVMLATIPSLWRFRKSSFCVRSGSPSGGRWLFCRHRRE